MTKIFKEESSSTLFEEQEDVSTDKSAPTAVLVEPYARKGTQKTKFNLAPCSGGAKGSSRYLASPGDKANVQWIIQNPVKQGKCKISIAKGHPDDLASFHFLKVESDSFNRRNGQFKCGSPDKTVEDAMVQLPTDMTCEDCTLQWQYEAPGYGKLLPPFYTLMC